MEDTDKERLIDDFVFLMILMGDDFLPELPSLDINEGSVQLIVSLYK
jgi:singapore isolate B (sub-type 7) whole genome shotgun sequence assembly, scaffold_13